MNFRSAFAASCAALFIASFAGAQEKDASLTAWYDALQKVDVAALEAVLAPESFAPFEYKITDLGIIQNRKEFIASMPEWAGAIDGGTIAYKITESFEGGYKVKVCYKFSSSELLAEEEVGVYDTKITGISQKSLGDSCAKF